MLIVVRMEIAVVCDWLFSLGSEFRAWQSEPQPLQISLATLTSNFTLVLENKSLLLSLEIYDPRLL